MTNIAASCAMSTLHHWANLAWQSCIQNPTRTSQSSAVYTADKRYLEPCNRKVLSKSQRLKNGSCPTVNLFLSAKNHRCKPCCDCAGIAAVKAAALAAAVDSGAVSAAQAAAAVAAGGGAVAAVLRAAGPSLLRSVEVVAFCDEEGIRFACCTGMCTFGTSSLQKLRAALL